MMRLNEQEVLDILKECEKVVKSWLLPEFSLEDVRINFGRSESKANYRELNFESYLPDTKLQEYEHIEKRTDLSTTGIRIEHWLGAHELSHVIAYEFENLDYSVNASELEMPSDMNEQANWELIHGDLLTYANYWYKNWGTGFAKTSPIEAFSKYIRDENWNSEQKDFLKTLLLNFTNWTYTSNNAKVKIGKQVDHGSFFQEVYKLLRTEVVNPKSMLDAIPTVTKQVKYRKPTLKKFMSKGRV